MRILSKIKSALVEMVKKALDTKLGITLIILPIAFLPTELFSFLWWLLGPTNFWENLAVMIVGFSFLGLIQLFLLVIFLVLMWHVWLG